jgi:hypothetical protein
LHLIKKRDPDLEPRFSNVDANYFRLCTEQNLALPLVKRLHILPSLVLPAQRTFLATAFFFGATFFLATFFFGATFFVVTFRLGAAFFVAGFFFGAAFFVVAFLALRIETPPGYGFVIHESFFWNACQGIMLHIVQLFLLCIMNVTFKNTFLHVVVMGKHLILSRYVSLLID